MFGGGDEHALFHQAGGVADARHVAADRLDFKAVEIGAAKNHARSRGGGQDPQVHRSAAVQSHAAAFHRRADCLFVYQVRSAILLDDESTLPGAGLTVAN